MSTYLDDRRREIAETDRAIMELLRRRLDLAEGIGRYKAENGMEVVDPDAEERVVARYRLLADEQGFDPDRAEGIARILIAESVERESALRGRGSFLSAPMASPSDPHDRSYTSRSLRLMLALAVGLAAAVAGASAAVAYVFQRDHWGVVACMMALPAAMVFVDFMLSYADIRTRSRADAETRYYVRRALFFGAVLAALSAGVLALVALGG